MKVKELLEALQGVDPELDVAVLTATDEYWGNLYGIADNACREYCSIDGPKRPGKTCFVITGY